PLGIRQLDSDGRGVNVQVPLQPDREASLLVLPDIPELHLLEAAHHDRICPGLHLESYSPLVFGVWPSGTQRLTSGPVYASSHARPPRAVCFTVSSTRKLGMPSRSQRQRQAFTLPAFDFCRLCDESTRRQRRPLR